MTGAALCASQAVPRVERDLLARHLLGWQHWMKVRVGNSRAAARFARFAPSSPRAQGWPRDYGNQWGIESLLLKKMVQSASRG